MLLLVTGLLVALGATAWAGPVESNWIFPASGAWGFDSHWDTSSFPNNDAVSQYDAIIDAPGSLGVFVTQSITVDSLYVGTADSVQVANGQALNISALNGRRGIDNHGTIFLNSTTTWSYLTLRDGPVHLTGGGEILGSESAQYARIGGLGGAALINVDNTIRGPMYLGYNQIPIENSGLITADHPSDPLRIDPMETMINSGTVRAENGAVLELLAADYDNTGGVIEGAGGQVDLVGTLTVTGGTLQTSDGGAIVSKNGSVRLTDVTNLGRLVVNNAFAIAAAGNLANQDTIHLNSTTTWAYLTSVGGPLTLSGGGVVAMGDGGQYARLGSNDGSLFQNVDNRIIGAGYVGYNQMGLTNGGQIVADNPTHPLSLDPGADGMVNTGLLRAENGARLELEAGDYDNTAGVIEAADGGVVRIDGTALITGGVLQTSGGGEIVANSGGARIVDATNLGKIRVGNAYALGVTGTIANQDTIHLDSTTTWSYLTLVGGPVTLTGGGVVRCGGGGRYARISSGDGSRLINQDNILSGAGYLGYNSMGVTNAGVIVADDPNWSLNIDVNEDGFLNTGTLRLTGAGGLSFAAGDIDQQGLLEIAAGTTADWNADLVQTAGTSTIDGLLDIAAGRAFQLQGGVLGGTGEIQGDVNNSGGAVAPGASAGELTVTGDYVQDAAGELAIEIGGYVAGGDHDLLTVSGEAALAGEVRVTFTGGFEPAVDDTFVVLTAASATGNLVVVTGDTFPAGILPWVAVLDDRVVITIEEISITDVDDEPGVPSVRGLSVAPNPSSSGRFGIDYALADKAARVRLEVYDVAGRRVRVLEGAAVADKSLGWDGRDDAGRQQPNGMYFLRLETLGGERQVKRMTILR